MRKTVICDLLGIEYPIIQGGMAWVSTASLAAAVSEAGGLGIIGSGHNDGKWVREQVIRAREITAKPFGVNVMMMSPFVEEVMQVILEEKVPVITTGAGNPAKYIPQLKEIGTKVIPVIPSVALAQRLEKAGVDAVVAEGTESGGHIGELTTMALVPQVVDAVKIPVIAAGGIADGRGVVAALALGAAGVQIGTRFMCALECEIHENIKQMILKAKDRDTAVSGRVTGHPVRSLKNKLTKLYEEMERNCAPVTEMEELGAGKLKSAMIDGDTETGTVACGQIAGLIKEIKTAEEIINEIITGARSVVATLEV
ncbi:enoyl-[acyl-carrier-protein] reductase FabK [Phosphitispora fastidiosa]|uniref:enoyl-[acyl-carrier-protein] reductase FabK n=1 Tax=Phosphitispora fastidiosa TaxID=2837202 RepID=UPI001E5735FC|nr:enoyl-[acyl-carrier-protein] reductase FabK [Phosphitispora fastidiosa]MBU7005484.1 enoyl-[acyl-carrier protein] reductase II [Phosphitispora fastidiosa]